ncbi:maleylpyruvate isomerase family mycothiol-dependent enzyme [Streptomyces sp. NRRL B-24085]|uniref:maleylpyruvate isomerase family mycothiol-dependent enzyme n=1 Tax=Streptomyces sp. NRRL B-24085 TaxID=1709476 RepID=UPI0006B316FE|nr:maleylpyruvate isomerase family mycothiol-dependent enzyme [Streptomyces sp. NRRL B-24085]
MTTTAGAEERLNALRASSDRLRRLVDGLSETELTRQSFARDWTIAQVLSHLGSAAEICLMLVKRGAAGDMRAPVREDMLPVWERWDALPPLDQRAAWREADMRHLALLDSLGTTRQDAFEIPYFAGPLSTAEYAGYRLSEQSVHAWDIAVALDASAVIPAEEVVLLWQRIDLVASRFRDGDTLGPLAPAQVAIELTDRNRTQLLDLGAELHVYPAEPADPVATLTGTSEAVVRLVYGRHRPGIDPLRAEGKIGIDDLRALFPGF